MPTTTPTDQSYHGVDSATNTFSSHGTGPLFWGGTPSHPESHLVVSLPEMASLIGIYRPTKSDSNLSWARKVGQAVNSVANPGREPLTEIVGNEGEFVALVDRYAIGGFEQGHSESGRVTALVSGRLHKPNGGAGQLAERFERGGLSCLEEAKGPFVAACYDQKTGNIALSRSASGQRSIFIARIPGGLLFSTDACWLSTHEEASFALDPRGVADYLNFGVIWGTQTLSVGVERLLPGSACVADRSGSEVSITNWVRHPRGDEIPDAEDALQALTASLAESMHRTAEIPAPAALCLSAGLDSRSLLAVAHKAGVDLDCITAGVEGALEFDLTGRMCRILDARHMKILFDERLGSDLETYASRIAMVSNGEADFMNMMMLYQGIDYQEQFGLQSVIRGHGGELMKLNHAYGFAVPEEVALSSNHAMAKEQIQKQLTRSVSGYDVASVLKKDFSSAFRDEAAPSFEENYDALAGNSAHVGQAISLLFLTQYNGRNTTNAVRCMMDRLEVSQPILDEDVLSILLQMPISMRSNTKLQIELIRRNCPALLKVPNSALGISLTASKAVTRAATLFARVRRRLGFGLEEVPEDWLNARLHRFFKPVLLGDRALARPHVNPDALRVMVTAHENGDSTHRLTLGRLAMLEMLLRHHDRYSSDQGRKSVR